MAAFKRTELDMVGLARQDNQAAIQLFAIRGGKMIGRDVFLLDAAREAPDEEVLSSFLCSTTRARRRSRRRCSFRSPCPTPADLEAFLTARRGRPSRLAVPQRGEKRELMALATRNAGETLAREQARWLADEGKTLGGPGGAGRGARPARAADADRVLRHLEHPGLRHGRQHGRVRGGQAADRGVPPVQDPDGRRAERLRRRTRRCCAGGSAGPRRARRAARRRSAGRCPTS